MRSCCSFFLAHVPKNHHDSENNSVRIFDRSSAVGDGDCLASFIDQHRVVGKSHDLPGTEHFRDRVFHQTVRFFILQ